MILSSTKCIPKFNLLDAAQSKSTPTTDASLRMFHFERTAFTTTPASMSSSQRNKYEQPNPSNESNAPQSSLSILMSTSTSSVNASKKDHSIASFSSMPPPPSASGGSWHSSGCRVPLVSWRQRLALLHCLATGVRPGCPLSTCFGWARLLETAGRSLVDYILTELRQSASRSTTKPSHHRLPYRVLVLPTDSHLGSSLSIALARLLANRNACLFVLSPPPVRESSTLPLAETCQSEVSLLFHSAPRCHQYGGSDADASDCEDDEDDNETEVVTPFCPADSQTIVDTGNMIDSSPLGRLWLSRMRGMRLFKQPTSIRQLPTNVAVDLVIIGHPGPDSSSLQPCLVHWLRQHQALSRVLHLVPQSASLSHEDFILPNASSNLIVELGLPCSLPIATESFPAKTNVRHLLVDVGLSRRIVRQCTGDLAYLPPCRLFECSSVVELKAVQLDSEGVQH